MALAEAQLRVRVEPANSALKSNIEGYIGSLGKRDEEALLRFSRGAVEQARDPGGEDFDGQPVALDGDADEPRDFVEVLGEDEC